ncbi:triose-phosphate isomerase [Candidatus Bipolaricaulota bacterium]|nr:triose-phosphate isomerase [Candidatus Bipolaricaulota bacterium]
MRKPIIAANWKLHKTQKEATKFLNDFREKVKYISEVEIGLGPTFTSLDVVAEGTQGTGIKLCAQNVYFEDEGAFTGEVSPEMLVEVGTDYVIVGHSERRQIFGETDRDVNKKIHAVFDHGMKPILCIGETEAQRADGKTESVLRGQLKSNLRGLTEAQASEMIVAYEPIWAIGTGESASPEDAQAGCKFARDQVSEIVGEEAGEGVRLQYGGSIKPHNAEELMSQPDIDGGLIGSASLNPKSFAEIISITEELYQ